MINLFRSKMFKVTCLYTIAEIRKKKTSLLNRIFITCGAYVVVVVIQAGLRFAFWYIRPTALNVFAV